MGTENVRFHRAQTLHAQETCVFLHPEVSTVPNAYVIDTTQATDLPVTVDAMQTVAPGGQGDGFLVKLDADGRLVYWKKTWRGPPGETHRGHSRCGAGMPL